MKARIFGAGSIGNHLSNALRIFDYQKFDKTSRFKYALSYSKFCKLITDQNINVIFSTVSLYNQVRSWNRKNISNYITSK